MTQPPTMNTREIAEAFRKPIEWWYRNKDRLMAAGFPKPIPGLGNLWSTKLVLEFINRQPSTGNNPANDQSAQQPEAADDWETILMDRIPKVAASVRGRRRA